MYSATMPPRKRMKQIKVEDPEPALDNAQELQQRASVVVAAVQQQALVARVMGEDQARVMEGELVQAKVQLAELNALLQSKDGVIHAKDALLESKELQLEELRAEIRRLQLTSRVPQVQRKSCLSLSLASPLVFLLSYSPVALSDLLFPF